MKGKIKTMNEKMFGFITPEDGGRDVFFHYTALNGTPFDSLKVGDMVSFDVEQAEKGPRAINVQLAS
jgi:cold shock protein